MGLFKSHNIHYQADPIIVVVTFKSAIEFRHATPRALADFQELEATLRQQNTIDRNNLQRTQASKAKGNTEAVIAKLDTLLPLGTHSKNMAHQIAEKKENKNKDKLDVLYSIYDANTEALSPQFNHIFTKNMVTLKQALIAKLKEFDQEILQDPAKKFHKQLVKENKLIACRQVIHQTQQLIGSAKTLSGVFAGIAIGADILAQMGVVHDTLNTDSAADLFIDTLPQVIQSQPEMSLGARLNTIGSAFQLEHARNSLIAKLEGYLNQRARLDKTNSHEESPILLNYTPIDRGFFYNKTLQNERIRVAATLLTRLQCMQLNDGIPIDNPSLFANLLADAITDNENCQARYGRIFDKQGELAKQLEDMRQEMGKIYTQQVNVDGKSYLHEQLDLPKPASTTYGTMASH